MIPPVSDWQHDQTEFVSSGEKLAQQEHNEASTEDWIVSDLVTIEDP